MVLPTLRVSAWMCSFCFKMIQNMNFLIMSVLHEIYLLRALRAFDLVVHFLFNRPNTIGSLHSEEWQGYVHFLSQRSKIRISSLCVICTSFSYYEPYLIFNIVVLFIVMRSNTMILPIISGREWMCSFHFK